MLNILIALAAFTLNVTAQVTTSTVNVQEGQTDLAALKTNGYSLQISKSVAGPDPGELFNVVLTSEQLLINMAISWTDTFGLNWITEIPVPGAIITATGDWVACELGQTFDLDSGGSWIISNSTPNNNNSLNIGNNGAGTPVHIIVGIEDSNNNWTPIYVDSSALLPGAHGQYEPLEDILLWYQQGDLTSTMIDFQGTDQENFTMQPGAPHWFYYNVASGTWIDSPAPINPMRKLGKRFSSFLGNLPSLF